MGPAQRSRESRTTGTCPILLLSSELLRGQPHGIATSDSRRFFLEEDEEEEEEVCQKWPRHGRHAMSLHETFPLRCPPGPGPALLRAVCWPSRIAARMRHLEPESRAPTRGGPWRNLRARATRPSAPALWPTGCGLPGLQPGGWPARPGRPPGRVGQGGRCSRHRLRFLFRKVGGGGGAHRRAAGPGRAPPGPAPPRPRARAAAGRGCRF